jgi:hypothetical protein
LSWGELDGGAECDGRGGGVGGGDGEEEVRVVEMGRLVGRGGFTWQVKRGGQGQEGTGKKGLENG